MHRVTVVLIGVLVGLIAATASGALLRVGGSDGGETAFFFSVIMKNPTTPTHFLIIFGSGTFDDSGVQGSGVFSINMATPPTAANTLSSGTWTATNFVSFATFGFANPRSEGGQLVLKVTLNFDNGQVLNGVTMVQTCLVGSPPTGVDEGVTLSAPETFNTHVMGITTFSAPSED